MLRSQLCGGAARCAIGLSGYDPPMIHEPGFPDSQFGAEYLRAVRHIGAVAALTAVK